MKDTELNKKSALDSRCRALVASMRRRFGACFVLCACVQGGCIRSKQDQRRGYHLWATSSCTSGNE